jgi:UDP-N-acetylmuramoyl-tripeptide--D-alanyl-D-alanine ligase
VREWPHIVSDASRPTNPPAPAFDAASLALAAGGRVVRASPLPIVGGAVDSRRVRAGNCFFALPGERTDGHEFLVQAKAAGAAALVVSRRLDDELLERLWSDGEGPSIVAVEDGLRALQAAGRAWRRRFSPLVVGVTGSLAKTSTKEQVAEVMSERWNVLRNEGNENNEIGLPLTLLRLAPKHEAAVLEMGMYVPGDIAHLAALAEPRIGVVTAVRGTHLSRAGSLDAIERGKRELVEALPSGGTAVLNADDPRVARMAGSLPAGVHVLRYGFTEAADVTAMDVESRGVAGMRYVLRAGGEELAVESPALGRHSVHNGLAAAAVGIAAGLDIATIAHGLTRPLRLAHRSTLLELGEWRILDDTYNAAPDSMVAALDLLATLPGRRIAVLGEMLELGDAAREAHRAVGAHAAARTDRLIAVGSTAPDYVAGASTAGMAPASISGVADVDAALAVLLRDLRPGDVVLLKGSRGAALDVLVDKLRDASAAGARA